MALSAAMQWALNNGMTAADVYKNINDFLATNPTAAQSQAQMAQYGISGEDVAAATGGKSGGMLGGNILAGASWNSLNTTLGDQLTAATGQASSNYSVGGATTADTLKQLNTFLAGGGQFDPNATVYLQTGGVDFLQGVDKGTIKDNISQMVKTLGSQGVNVVLTGSPYAASLNDVQTNNFNPAVDPLFTEIAKENKNVALVGTQGEILQNKALLVDALHTNAEGTAIYNQSVIDALSQFKNTVPASTPQAIAQAQQTNTIAVTPPVITQAAASPPVAQALATKTQNQTIQNLISSGALTQDQATLINGTYYQPVYQTTGSGMDQQTGALESVLAYNAADNKTGGAYDQYDAQGNLIYQGTQQKVPSFTGGLADMLNDPVIQAALLAGGAGGFLGNALGLTGSAAQAVGTGVFKGGSALAGGADIGDALKVGLLSGGLVYGGNALNNYLTTGTTADPGITERQFAAADAKQLAAQGLSPAQIQDTLTAGGYNDITVERAVASITPPTASTAATTTAATGVPATSAALESVNITGTAAPAITNAGGLLSSLVTTPTAVSTPVTNAGTVNVTGTAQPQQVDQSVLNLINSQLASNVIAPSNLANVQVTGNKGMMSGDTTNTDIINTLAGLSTVPATADPRVTVTADRPATKQELVNTITAAIPTVTSAQAAEIAEKVIISGNPVTVQDAVTALAAVVPAVITPATTPVTTSTAVDPRVTITADRPVVTPENINTIAAAIPTPTVTADPRVTITADRPVITPENINTIAAAISTPVVTTDPRVTITADRPVVTPEAINTAASVIPTPTVTPDPRVTITTDRSLVTPENINTAAAAVIPTPVVTPAVTPDPRVTVTADRPVNVGDALAALPTTMLPPSVTTPTTTTPAKTNELGLTDAQMLALLKGGLGLLGGLGGASLIGGGNGGTSTGVGALPTQGMPMYNDDYFTRVQQNYNRILPAVPRDVASPLRDWYTSQYGA